MSEIRGKNIIFDVEHGQDRPSFGTESEVRMTKVTAKNTKGKTRILRNKFVEKQPLESLVAKKSSKRLNAGKSLSELREETVQEWYKKFMLLKSINDKQGPKEHKFNLPKTIRLTTAEDGAQALLISSLKSSDSDNFIDLKNAEKYCFSRADAENIERQIIADINLAEKFKINLSHGNIFYPLDTWVYLKKEGKIVISDVAERVQLDSSDEDLQATRKTIQACIQTLRISSKTQFSPRQTPDDIGE